MGSENDEKHSEKAEAKKAGGHNAPSSFAQKAGAGTHNALNSIAKSVAAKAFVLLIVGLVVGVVLGQAMVPTTGVAMFGLPAASNSPTDMDALKAKVQNYIQQVVSLQQDGLTIKVNSIETFNESFYTVNFDILSGDQVQNSSMVLLTKDGLALVGSQPMMLDEPLEAPDTTDTTVTTAPKSDKPKVELFVFSYCPYGTQAEKAIIPVVELLGAEADFSIVQIGAMHGAHEETEAKRQACILKNYPDKFWSYLAVFDTSTEIGTCNSDTICAAPLIETIFTALGIDKAKIDSCISTDGTTLYNADVSYAKSLNIGSSPTFMINGTSVNVARSPEAIKQAICDAFNTAPADCSQTLSTTSASAGFGGGTGTTSNAGCG